MLADHVPRVFAGGGFSGRLPPPPILPCQVLEYCELCFELLRIIRITKNHYDSILILLGFSGSRRLSGLPRVVLGLPWTSWDFLGSQEDGEGDGWWHGGRSGVWKRGVRGCPGSLRAG